MAAAGDALASLLNNLSDALRSTSSSLGGNLDLFLPPNDGISLLDVKNDLLLSYIHNIVFLILLKLRSSHEISPEDAKRTHADLVRSLLELRIYLDKGLRPVEKRMKYTIDQYLRANQARNPSQTVGRPRPAKLAGDDGSSDSEAGSEADGEGRSVDSNGGNEEDLAGPHLLDLAHATPKGTSRAKTSSNGVYKPPRLNPTAMPDPEARSRAPRQRQSQLLNEYIDEEMSSAPRAQPSIGSNNTILQHGRGGMSQRDRDKERERIEYEERNFLRLPGESKAERKKARRRGELHNRDMFGGEDWTGLGGLGDRVSRSVAGGKSTTSVLQRRQKRRATEDLPRGDGTGIGDAFEKRRRVFQARAEKKARKKRR